MSAKERFLQALYWLQKQARRVTAYWRPKVKSVAGAVRRNKALRTTVKKAVTTGRAVLVRVLNAKFPILRLGSALDVLIEVGLDHLWRKGWFEDSNDPRFDPVMTLA